MHQTSSQVSYITQIAYSEDEREGNVGRRESDIAHTYSTVYCALKRTLDGEDVLHTVYIVTKAGCGRKIGYYQRRNNNPTIRN